MKFNPIESGFPGAPCSSGELLDSFPDVRSRHPPARKAMQRIRLVGRADAVGLLNTGDIPLSSAVAQLQNELAIEFMNTPAQFTPEWNSFVLVDRGVIRKNSAADRHRHKGRDDSADAPACKLQLPVDTCLIAGPVVVVEPPGTFDRKIRFLTVRFRNESGWKISSAITAAHCMSLSRSRDSPSRIRRGISEYRLASDSAVVRCMMRA